MLTYLIILLDDTSASFCHYDVRATEHKLISITDLESAVIFAMKENLNIQFVYPDYELPEEYREIIDSVDHTKIGRMCCGETLDMTIVDTLSFEADRTKNYLLRCTLSELNMSKDAIADVLPKIARLNIVLTDILTWKEDSFETYKSILDILAEKIAEHYQGGISVQLNLLTDRFMLRKMNNCDAGDSNITLAPDGRFYICPAFYPGTSVGSLKEGLLIPNKQLYRLDHAPICRNCDAFQCRRCVWMNEQATLDCNTPSREQCVTAHLERNASRKLLSLLDSKGVKLENYYSIDKIDYLDPFKILNKWK